MYKKIRQHRHTGQYSVLMPILFTLLVSPFVHAIPDRTSGTVVIYTGFAASASPNAPADAGKTARIAQKQAENEPAPLPDLTVESLDGGATRTDAQTLLLSGTLTATVKNGGGAPAPANISLKAFFDINLNGTYEAGLDISLGDAFIENALAAAESTAIDIAVSGQMPFRDAPLTVWADSSQSVPESNEENNFSADSKHCVSSGGALEPVLKWERNGGRVAHAPITGPLLDTDENGVIDEHDTPAVIVLEGYSLAALDGKTGAVLWRNERSFRTYGVTPALGDIDGDGKPEIIAYLPERKVIVLNNDGTEKWISEAIFDEETVLALSGPAIADLDADGQAEIIAANIVLNADGSVKWAGSPTSTLTPIAVDLDKDGAPEVVTGRHVYRADGSLYWSFPNNCGFYSASVADFDGDAYPEIISVTANKISLFEHDGTLKGAIGVAGVQTGSPAMIADLDGDGAPEIGIGGTAHFQVFDSNSGLKWQTPVSAPSGMAGASVFDFEGDGRAEIVYQDAETLYIFAGDTGEILFSTPNAPSAGSAVWIEYPVIADIDNDGHADLLVANGSGIRVFQDADNAWANARGIWNQHTYHITNVDNDGGIPLREESNWEIYNSWRGTRIPGGNDLSAGYPRIIDNGPGQGLAVQVRAGNAGAATSPAELSIAFYAGDPAAGGVLLGTAAVGALEPGTWQDLQADGIESSAFEQEIYALIDADERLPECNETNNSVSLISRIVSGYIRDKSGAPLSGAAVQINGRPETAVTDANGYYRIIGLAEGVYTLSIAKEGYLFEAKEIVVGGNNPEVDLVCTVCGGTPGYAPGYILIARETGHNEIVIRDGEGELVRRFDTGTTGNDISVATGDFFGDGADRIVVNADKQLQFYDFDGEKLAVLAVEKQGDVAAGDIDGDGMEEALTTAKSANDNRVTVYGTNGEVRTVDIGSAGKNTRLSVAAADLDGDGAAEIIAGTLLKDNKVALYSADGTELAVFEVFSDVNARTVRKPGDQGNACSHSGQGVPKFCDDADTDNGDGADTDNGDGADTDNGDGADTDNGDGADTDNDGGGGKKYGVNVAAGDLDGDGVPELVAGMAGKGGVVEVYTVSGGLIHSFSAFDDNSGVEISVGDTDGDGEGEIIAGNAKGTEVRIFKADGTLLRVFAGLDRERVGSLAFAKGSAPVTAVAVDAGLQPISTDAELFGGVSVSGKPRMPKASVHTNDTVKITAKIKADKKHAGKHAKIVTVFNYSPGGEDLPPQNFILNAQGIVMPWDGDPDTLADTGANNGVTLGEGETLSIYEGRLPQGVINIFFGYRVEEDGALIFNGAPISITIHGEK